MKLKKIFLLLILVLLFLGISYAAETTNDTTTTDTHIVLKESSTATNPVDTSIKQESNINKEIKKQTNENKTTKTATKNYEVSDYNTLHNALTTGTYNTVTINVKSDIKLSGNTTLNEAITSLTIKGNGKTINGNDKYQFLNIGSLCSVDISNLKITNCYGEWGGAIFNSKGTLTLNNTTFNNNNAKWDGGAICNDGNLTLSNTEFNNNTAEDGGAILNYEDSTLKIINTTFNNNKAENYGGAIHNLYVSTLTITNTTFNNNKAEVFGGAIWNTGTLNITKSIFYNNNAKFDGGAIDNEGDTLTIANTRFNNNKAERYGGAINTELDSTLRITDTIFNNNTSLEDGGAINTWNGTITITKSTFNNNTAKSNGAAIYNEGTLTVTNNTFSQNRANTTGKAIINKGKATITNNTNSETSKYSSTIYTNATKATITNNIFNDGFSTKLTIKTNNTNPYINDTIKITFTLKNQNNKAITNEKITVTINGKKYTLTTNTKGIATKAFKATTYGTYNITAKYTGTKTQPAATNTTSIYVKPYTWIKIGYNGYVNKGSTVKILARILNNTTAVKYVPVNVTIDNKTYKIKSDGAGYIRLNYTVKDYNDHNITFKFNGNKKYHAVTNSTTLKVKQPTKVLMANMTNVPYGYKVEVVGKLVHGETGIKYTYVNVTINNKLYTLKTDGAGYFRINYTVDSYNDQKITFKFNGNNKYLPSTNTTIFKIKKDTLIRHATIGKIKQGSIVQIVGRLQNKDNGVKYVPVRVKINNKEYNLKTDGAGYYRLNYTATDLGTNTFTSIFDGNNLYRYSTNSTQFTVVKP